MKILSTNNNDNCFDTCGSIHINPKLVLPLIANGSSRFQVTSNPHNKLYACQYTSINLSILSYLFFTFYSILLSLLFFLTFLSKSSLLYHSSSKISYTFSTNPLELSSNRRTLSKLSK